MQALFHVKHLALGLCSLALTCASAPAQTWTQSGAPSNSWAAIACSADGSKLLAASAAGFGGQIYISKDGGTHWQLVAGPSQACQSVVSSADGTKLAALGLSGSDIMFVSTNSGATWVSHSTVTGPSQSLVCSADGSILAGISIFGGVVLSTNFGALWAEPTTPLTFVSRVICSTDGTKLAALGSNNGRNLFVSTNVGLNWSKNGSTGQEYSLALAGSSDLGTVIGVTFTTPPTWVVTSTNLGQTWLTNDVPVTNWSAVAVSAQGTRLVAVSPGGLIYSSGDAGKTWTSNNAPALHWQAVASTADGNTLFAAAANGGIWVGRSVPGPVLSIGSSSNALKMSWVVPSSAFVVEQTGFLGNGGWSDITNSPTLNFSNLNNELLLSAPGIATFYRLKMQ